MFGHLLKGRRKKNPSEIGISMFRIIYTYHVFLLLYFLRYDNSEHIQPQLKVAYARLITNLATSFLVFHLIRLPDFLYFVFCLQGKMGKMKWEIINCRPITNERENVYSKCLVMKSSKKYFIFSSAYNLIIWLLISPKNFEKKGILKTWLLVSLRSVKTNFGKK